MLHRLSSLFLTLLVSATAQQAGGSTLLELIAANDDLSILKTLINLVPDLIEDLGGDSERGELTLFAPSNDAFNSFHTPFQTFFTLPWEAHLDNAFRFHGTVGSLLSTDLVDGMQLTMLNNEVLTVNVMNGTTVVLTSVLGTEASTVIQENTEVATNGVVHVVNSIMVPAWYNRSLFSMLTHDDDDDKQLGTDRLSIFSELLVLSGASDLFEPGVFSATILAPTNAAFEALDEETMAFYRNPNNARALYDLVINHVVIPVLPSNGLTDGLVVTTMSELELVVSVAGDEVMFNDATVMEADILAVDGIVHVVDAVLIMPPASRVPTESMAPVSQAPTAVPRRQRNNITVPPSKAPIVLRAATAPPSRVPTTVAPVPLSTTSQSITTESLSTIDPTVVPTMASYTSPVPTRSTITTTSGISVGTLIGVIVGCLAAGGMATACFFFWRQSQNKLDLVIATGVASPEYAPAEEIPHNNAVRLDDAPKVLPDYKDQVRGGAESGHTAAPLALAVLLHGSVDADGSIVVDAEATASSILWPTSFPSQAGARPANN